VSERMGEWVSGRGGEGRGGEEAWRRGGGALAGLKGRGGEMVECDRVCACARVQWSGASEIKR
jgi:hypothetical protein